MKQFNLCHEIFFSLEYCFSLENKFTWNNSFFVKKYPFLLKTTGQKCEWSNLRLLGREWNLRGEKWAKFYSHSWDWTRARKIWEIDPSHFWSLPFWLITLGSGWSSWSENFGQEYMQRNNPVVVRYIQWVLPHKMKALLWSPASLQVSNMRMVISGDTSLKNVQTPQLCTKSVIMHKRRNVSLC